MGNGQRSTPVNVILIWSSRFSGLPLLTANPCQLHKAHLTSLPVPDTARSRIEGPVLMSVTSYLIKEEICTSLTIQEKNSKFYNLLRKTNYFQLTNLPSEKYLNEAVFQNPIRGGKCRVHKILYMSIFYKNAE